jgi:DNA-binding NarL/FixJ family response regulator
MIKVLVVAKTLLTCDLLKAVLSSQDGMQVVGQATRVSEAMSQVKDCDIVLVRPKLPQDGTIELIQTVAAEYPQVKTLVIGLPKSEPMILPYLEAGASGYVLREDSTEQMVEKIRAVYMGRPIICPEIAAALMSRVAELADFRHGPALNVYKLADLTSREKEVLELIGRDLSNREIANRLYIEVGTVKNHVHNILKKLNVRSRYDATAYLPVLKSLHESSRVNGNLTFPSYQPTFAYPSGD